MSEAKLLYVAAIPDDGDEWQKRREKQGRIFATIAKSSALLLLMHQP